MHRHLRTTIAALALAAAAAMMTGCQSDDTPKSADPATAADSYDPTKPTTPPTDSTEETAEKLVADLERHGFKVSVGKSERDRFIQHLRLREGTIDGVEMYIGVASTDEALQDKLSMLNGFGSIAVYSTTGRWIINPGSAMTDDATFTKSAKLADAIGKALYADWQDSVRVSVPD